MALWSSGGFKRQIRPIGLGGLRNAAHGDGSRLPTPRKGRDVRPCSPSRLEGREVVGGALSLSLGFESPQLRTRQPLCLRRAHL